MQIIAEQRGVSLSYTLPKPVVKLMRRWAIVSYLSITHNSVPYCGGGLKSVTINFGASLLDCLHGAMG